VAEKEEQTRARKPIRNDDSQSDAYRCSGEGVLERLWEHQIPYG
jgi:hypothetical protein